MLFIAISGLSYFQAQTLQARCVSQGMSEGAREGREGISLRFPPQVFRPKHTVYDRYDLAGCQAAFSSS